MEYVNDAYKFGALLCGLHGAGRLAGLSDIAAHVVPQAVAFLILAVLGVDAWRSMYEDVGTTPGVYAEAHANGIRCCILQIPFQLYELACAARVKRLRGKTFEMVAHHALALLLACLAVNKDIYYFYGTYFFGVSELSSLPLVFLDLFKMFPEVKKRYPLSNELIRPFFCVCFLVLRTFYWPYVSYHFWSASLTHYPNDALEVMTFCTVNLLLSALQAFWTYLIIIGLYKLAIGDPGTHDVDKID